MQVSLRTQLLDDVLSQLLDGEELQALTNLLRDYEAHLRELEELIPSDTDPDSVDMENDVYDKPGKRERINILIQSLHEMEHELKGFHDHLATALADALRPSTNLPNAWSIAIDKNKQLPEPA
jgi:hypothetical protein